MLDGTSPSYDSDSEITYLPEQQLKDLANNLSLQNIQDCIDENFSGEITQIPPKYSALKIDGKRALDRTLAGEEVIMKERKATILSSNIISYEYPKLIAEFTVTAGTYIRSIAFDL
jgi:tRNA pseudouridine55 synthase